MIIPGLVSVGWELSGFAEVIQQSMSCSAFVIGLLHLQLSLCGLISEVDLHGTTKCHVFLHSILLNLHCILVHHYCYLSIYSL